MKESIKDTMQLINFGVVPIAIWLGIYGTVRSIQEWQDPSTYERITYQGSRVDVHKHASGKTEVCYNFNDFSTLVDENGDGEPDYRTYRIPGKYAFAGSIDNKVTNTQRDLFRNVIKETKK